jgi:hypothetical protein
MLDEKVRFAIFDQAISFIKLRGTVTSAELHAHLGLDAGELPSAKLSALLDDGRLVKNGKFWGLGGTNPSEDGYLPPEDPYAHLSEGDKVIRFIKSKPNFRATNFEIRKLLGLEENEVPASRLGSYLATGKLIRHGTAWMVGAGYSGEESEVENMPRVEPAEPQLPNVPTVVLVTSSDDQAPRTVQVEEVPRFRIGDWSDGAIELQRNGVHLATLTKDEFEQIGKFYNLRAA